MELLKFVVYVGLGAFIAQTYNIPNVKESANQFIDYLKEYEKGDK